MKALRRWFEAKPFDPDRYSRAAASATLAGTATEYRPFRVAGQLLQPATPMLSEPPGPPSVAGCSSLAATPSSRAQEEDRWPVAAVAVPTRTPGPVSVDRREWVTWFERLVARRRGLGYSRENAALLAFGEAITYWHSQFGSRPQTGRCAGCGELIGSRAVWSFPDGAAVHTDHLRCLISYGEQWRTAAAVGLARMGIVEPTTEAPEGDLVYTAHAPNDTERAP
jgi:hypothetical protein